MLNVPKLNEADDLQRPKNVLTSCDTSARLKLNCYIALCFNLNPVHFAHVQLITELCYSRINTAYVFIEENAKHGSYYITLRQVTLYYTVSCELRYSCIG